MADILRWLLVAAIIIAAWFISKRRREAARKTARLLPVAAGVFLLGLAVTGWLRADTELAAIHRWTGHGFMVIVWLSVPFAIGVLLQQHFRLRPITAIAQLLVLLLVLGTVLLAVFTGYLGPSNSDLIGEATRNRFKILHLFFLPGFTFALLVEWWWFFSAGADRSERGRAR